MKKLIFVLAITAMAFVSKAQSGKNQLGIGPELGLSTTSGGGTAIGGTAKYMYGVGTAGQVTLTAGALFNSSTSAGFKTTVTDIPVLVGYRHYFSGIFVEPQVGYLSESAKVTYNGGSLSSGNSGSFAYGIGGGYVLPGGLDLGVSYRGVSQSGSSGMIVFRVAYNFSLGGK